MSTEPPSVQSLGAVEHKDLTHLLRRQEKHMWLIVRQLPMTADWWDVPLALWDLAKAIRLNSFVPTLCNRFPSSFTSTKPRALRRISDIIVYYFCFMCFHCWLFTSRKSCNTILSLNSIPVPTLDLEPTIHLYSLHLHQQQRDEILNSSCIPSNTLSEISAGTKQDFASCHRHPPAKK